MASEAQKRASNKYARDRSKVFSKNLKLYVSTDREVIGKIKSMPKLDRLHQVAHFN